jgi:hypothetical protein
MIFAPLHTYVNTKYIHLNFNVLIFIYIYNSTIVGILRCACTHPIDHVGIHFLHCGHGNECTRTHDVICNTFVTIAQDANFYMGQK